ncbi:MAG: DUF2336 domain-containing protein [Alphaproteobacteria bacterium]
MFRRILGRGDDGAISYERARELARADDPAVRRELATRSDIVPEILYYLAEDPDPVVRRHIATNAATPALAHMVLVGDADEEVRANLAGKISRLAPGLSTDEQDRVRKITYQVLDRLARDQVVRVRLILSETLKDLADAPPDVIRRLAHDVEAVVAGPVLEFSPVLSDEDLLEIIESTTTETNRRRAISRRANVGERVSDAIAATDDEGAIAVLLANPSAQIREDTLDRLVERAPSRQSWHEPMVHRPGLHSGAATRLAHFVADNLLRVMTTRKDLNPDVAAAVSKVVRRRIDEEGDERDERAGRQKAGGTDLPEPKGLFAPKPPKPDLKSNEAAAEEEDSSWRTEMIETCDKARKLHAAGKLGEAQIAKALARGEELFTAAAIAARSAIPPEVVLAVLDSQSPKGMLALAWKAGLSAEFAVKLQVKLAHIPPDAVLRPTEDDEYPMSEADLDWQLELFTDAATGGAL